jgi:hypothetical protein
MAARMVIPATAFSVGRPSTQKRPRAKNDGHLKFIRHLSCAACGTHASVEAAHVRMASPVHGKREAGKAEKPDDKWAVPLCMTHHNEQHDKGEREFWSKLRINPCDLALALWGCTGDDDMAEAVIRLQRERRR